MATPNRKTRALYTRLKEVLGNEHADTLMTYLPLEPGRSLATNDDIAGLEARLDQRFEQIDQRFEQIDQRWERRFQTYDDRMYGLQGVFRDQLKTYTVTMVGGMTALTAIYATLLAIVF